MSNSSIEIDTGSFLITLDADINRAGKVAVTCYVSGISIRSSSLVSDRLRGIFANTIVAACDFLPEEIDDEHRTYDAIIAFVEGALFNV